MRHLWEVENDYNFAEREEERIEKYCKDYGFEYCKDIDVTCEEEGCHKVTVNCDDDFYYEGTDRYDECRKFEVQIEHEIDKELTKREKDKEICV